MSWIREKVMLCEFFESATRAALRKPDYTLSLSELQELAPYPDSVFSWMQWDTDGKKWFSGDSRDGQACYTLKEHLRGLTYDQILKELRAFYLMWV